jgi:hypothetical protein
LYYERQRPGARLLCSRRRLVGAIEVALGAILL